MHTIPDAEVRIVLYSGFLANCIYFTLLALVLLPLARFELPVDFLHAIASHRLWIVSTDPSKESQKSRRREGEAHM